MSSSTSSSSHSQRTPLHERTNSEKNKQQIRLVPYTPPKIQAEDSGSRVPETPGSNVGLYSTKDRTSNASTLFGRERFIGSALSSPSSSSSPITSSTWVKGKGVSESSGTGHPTPPAPRQQCGFIIVIIIIIISYNDTACVSTGQIDQHPLRQDLLAGQGCQYQDLDRLGLNGPILPLLKRLLVQFA
ncbi:hypothetical protein ONZ43_g3918 [Nemania bipapillata]|uniref:Uncharacterized protein n=1 Tax=Nemania bipapillata TaxID=110536 RepID=A0ACC2IUC6_9PEZI|nr:hypothetical protein ONZ43_g3918 [Nemania bipapillata]